jgi:hypothetical protein
VHIIGKAMAHYAGPAVGRAIFEIGYLKEISRDRFLLHGGVHPYGSANE